MPTTYLARINEVDYELIRGILNDDLPSVYEVWLKFQEKGETDIERRGHAVEHIDIDADELARYCGAHGGHRSRHGLLHFVIKKSEGNKY